MYPKYTHKKSTCPILGILIFYSLNESKWLKNTPKSTNFSNPSWRSTLSICNHIRTRLWQDKPSIWPSQVKWTPPLKSMCIDCIKLEQKGTNACSVSKWQSPSWSGLPFSATFCCNLNTHPIASDYIYFVKSYCFKRQENISEYLYPLRHF